jgi:hypothetical protein
MTKQLNVELLDFGECPRCSNLLEVIEIGQN